MRGRLRPIAVTTLESLLADLMDHAELEHFVRRHYEQVFWHLPHGSTSRSFLSYAVVELLLRNGCIDEDFFTLLVFERPKRTKDIEWVASIWRQTPSEDLHRHLKEGDRQLPREDSREQKIAHFRRRLLMARTSHDLRVLKFDLDLYCRAQSNPDAASDLLEQVRFALRTPPAARPEVDNNSGWARHRGRNLAITLLSLFIALSAVSVLQLEKCTHDNRRARTPMPTPPAPTSPLNESTHSISDTRTSRPTEPPVIPSPQIPSPPVPAPMPQLPISPTEDDQPNLSGQIPKQLGDTGRSLQGDSPQPPLSADIAQHLDSLPMNSFGDYVTETPCGQRSEVDYEQYGTFLFRGVAPQWVVATCTHEVRIIGAECSGYTVVDIPSGLDCVAFVEGINTAYPVVQGNVYDCRWLHRCKLQ